MEAAEIPFPIPERTHPVTKIIFIEKKFKLQKKKEVKKDLFLSYDD